MVCAQKSLDKPKPCRLRFRTQDDALNYARDVLQYGADFFTAYGLNIPKRYAMGEIEVVLKVSAGRDYSEYEFVFFNVPGKIREVALASHDGLAQSDLSREKSDRGDELVFVGITELVESPDGVIPSLVRVERAKERYDIGGQILASPFDDVFESSNIVRNREVGGLGCGLTAQRGSSKSGLIKGGAQRLKALDGEVRDIVGQRPGHLELVKLVPGLRLYLNRSSVWLRLEKGFTLPGDFVDVLICAGEPALRAMERIGHGEHSEGSRPSNQSGGSAAPGRGA